MPAKKKAAKKPPRRDQRRRAVNAEAMVEQLAADLQRVLAERDDARKELAEARRGREAWCHKAVELELRAEKAEEQLKLLLAGITAQRPSQPADAGRCLQCERPLLKGLHTCGQATQREPGPTYGLPGDAPLPRPSTRFSREFCG